MEGIGNLSRDAQVVLGGAVVYVVLSLFNWQERAIGGITVVEGEWYGIGLVAGLIGSVLLVWELGRGLGAQFAMRRSKTVTSLVLALLLAIFTVITFVTVSSDRQWPAWAGLAVSLAIGVAACARARREGVRLPTRRA